MKHTDLSEAEFFYVANDATDEVKNFLKSHKIAHYIWENSDLHKQEWYINNVYRAWNFGAKKAKGEFLVFVNSDMAFSDFWLENLIKRYNKKNCVSSRLVESGKLKSGTYGIEKNFGRSIASYREQAFQNYAKLISKNRTKNGGLFMPLLVRRDDFYSVGGYPEGNIIPGRNIFNPKIAKQGEYCISGDAVLMKKLATKGIKHQTSFDSIVYHFQQGEMDSGLGLKDRLLHYLRFL